MRHRMIGLNFEKANFILSTKEKLQICCCPTTQYHINGAIGEKYTEICRRKKQEGICQ